MSNDQTTPRRPDVSTSPQPTDRYPLELLVAAAFVLLIVMLALALWVIGRWGRSGLAGALLLGGVYVLGVTLLVALLSVYAWIIPMVIRQRRLSPRLERIMAVLVIGGTIYGSTAVVFGVLMSGGRFSKGAEPHPAMVTQPIAVLVIAKNDEIRKRKFGVGCPANGIEGVAVAGELQRPTVVLPPSSSGCRGRKLVVDDSIGWAVPLLTHTMPSSGIPRAVDATVSTVTPEVIHGIVQALSLANVAAQGVTDMRRLLLDEAVKPFLRSFSKEAGKSVEDALLQSLPLTTTQPPPATVVIQVRNELKARLTASFTLSLEDLFVAPTCTRQSPATLAQTLSDVLAPELAPGLARSASSPASEDAVGRAVSVAQPGILRASLQLARSLEQKPKQHGSSLTVMPREGRLGDTITVQGLGSPHPGGMARLVLEDTLNGNTSIVELARAKTDSQGHFRIAVKIPHQFGTRGIFARPGAYSIMALPSGCATSFFLSPEPFTG